MTTLTSETLAVQGGPKVRPQPWPPRRLFSTEEKEAAIRLFDQAIAKGEAFGYNGPEEEAYCKAFADFLGGGYADAVNSGSNAVYVALRALELEPFGEVIVPPITDPGGAMPVALCNQIPVIADAAPGSYNTGADQIAARLTPRTRAIIVAHIAGLPVDMDPILDLARARNIPVIEDCAQAHGARYKGRMVGTLGTIGAFSTMFGKHHATGGQGGVVFTKDQDLYWRIRRHADRGKPFGLDAAAGNTIAALNCNSDELSCAIGQAQLRKLPSIIQRRRQYAKALAQGCRDRLRAVRTVEELPGCEGVYWFLFHKLDLTALRVDKATFVAAVAAEGLPVTPSYLVTPADAPWFQNHAAFGNSGYPWNCPLYQGNPQAVYEVPNIRATDAGHFRSMMHEGCGQQEVADALAIFEKVERAYAKR